jgi:hypothetical protein
LSTGTGMNILKDHTAIQKISLLDFV